MKRSLKNTNYRKRWSERFGDTDLRLKSSIWIHSVSVGESVSAEPLVKKILQEYPDENIVITTTTPTGSDVVEKLYSKYPNVHHTYIPYDIRGFILSFITRINPRIFIIIETEIWPNILSRCFENKIPVVISNARLSKRSFRRYSFFPFAKENLFGKISHISAQSQKDAKRFCKLSVAQENISVTGNLKYSMEIPESVYSNVSTLEQSISDRPVWTVGSTHKGEEEIILEAHKQILKEIPNCLLILVPRHKERFNKVSKLITDNGFTQERRSLSNDSINSETQVYLGDSMGELLGLYSIADITFVGGSLIKNGGHNVLEPAALKKAVISGPSLHNFSDIANCLKKENALNIVNNDRELAELVITLIKDKELLKKFSDNSYTAFMKNNDVVDKQFEPIKNILSHE